MIAEHTRKNGQICTTVQLEDKDLEKSVVELAIEMNGILNRSKDMLVAELLKGVGKNENIRWRSDKPGSDGKG